MALFNYATRELSAKIVYYGPGLSGKTTNIEMVHNLLKHEQKGRLISLPTETDRTLFFDFLPLDLGQIKGFRVRFHLYTVPGQVYYNATRRLVLQGVDGVVFVADSQRDVAGSNVESLKNLRENLATYGKKLEEIPFVMQYNKRDLRKIASVEQMNAQLNDLKAPVFEGIAKAGKGVTETLAAISRLVFVQLRKSLLLPGDAPEEEAVGEIADLTAAEAVDAGETELLEEISDFEEIPEPSEGPVSPGVSPEWNRAEPRESAGEAEARSPEESSEVHEIPELTDVPDGVEMVVPPREVPQVDVSREPFPGQEGEEEAPSGGGMDFPSGGVPDEIEIEIPESLLEAPEGVEAVDPTKTVPPEGDAGELPDEIEIEIPDSFENALPSGGTIPRASLEMEGEGITFLRFEDAILFPEGHAVIPAVFLDSAGNTVRIRIRISLEEGRG